MDIVNRESEKLLYEALCELLLNKSIDKLSVKDIISHAGISRATFYRLYNDKYDLLNKNYEKILENTLFCFNKGKTYKEATYSIYKVIKENKKFFQNAFRSEDLNCLKNYIFNMSKEFHLDILEKNGIDIKDWRVIKVVESFIYGNLEITEIWIMEGMKESVEELVEVLGMGIPSQFVQYFYPDDIK